MRLKTIALFSIGLIISCTLFNQPTVKKNEYYLITKGNDSYVFTVLNIQYKKSDDSRVESIDYRIFRYGGENNDIITSLINYHSVKTGYNTFFLEKVFGTDKISKDNISFSWSYGSSKHIYIYLEEGTKIEKITERMNK
jgi:hypothetical protein